MKQKIIKYPLPSLNRPCRPVEFPLTDEVRNHIQDLIDTLEATPNGIALASNQILEDGFRIFVVRRGTGLPQVVINPSWESVSMSPPDSGPYYFVKYVDEGCLSIPELHLKTHRKTLVDLSWQDDTGKSEKKMFRHLEAQIVQHECEHLDGHLLIEKADEKTRINVRSEAIRNRKAGR